MSKSVGALGALDLQNKKQEKSKSYGLEGSASNIGSFGSENRRKSSTGRKNHAFSGSLPHGSGSRNSTLVNSGTNRIGSPNPEKKGKTKSLR